MSIQQETKAMFEREGERAFGRGMNNPYRTGTAAWTWWNNGNNRQRAYYESWIENEVRE